MKLMMIGGLTAAVIAPILIGASCPPPRIPLPLGIVPDNDQAADTALPSCTADFVCISLANRATVSVAMALYRHNGFDPDDDYADTPRLSCCTTADPQVACPCPCDGKDTGDCMLDRIEILEAANLDTVNGQQTVTLASGQSFLKRVRCGDIKTLGAAVARDDSDPTANATDQAAPFYRDEAGGVPCGETIEFAANDLNDSGASGNDSELVQLIIEVEVSR